MKVITLAKFTTLPKLQFNISIKCKYWKTVWNMAKYRSGVLIVLIKCLNMLTVCFMIFRYQIVFLRIKEFLNQIILTWSTCRVLAWRCRHNKKVKIEAFYFLVEHLFIKWTHVVRDYIKVCMPPSFSWAEFCEHMREHIWAYQFP